MENIETRAIPECELRIEGDTDVPRITGYAAMFDKWSPDYGGFREIIRPGAFKDTLASSKSDVRGLFNHDPNNVLGRQKSETMTLEEDAKGLRFDIPAVGDTQVARDVVTMIRRGDVTGASFSFTVRKNGDTWEYDDSGTGTVKRELLSVDLFDVGPVTFPFYPQTKTAIRCMELFRRAHPRGRGRDIRTAALRWRQRIVVP
jgi:HK97 family phage prohead protease